MSQEQPQDGSARLASEAGRTGQPGQRARGGDRSLAHGKPGGRTRVEALAPAGGDSARDGAGGPQDREALQRAQHTLELLTSQAARLERALGERDYFAARSAAETITALRPGLRSSLAVAARHQEPGGNDHAPGGNDHAPGGNDHAPGGDDHAPGSLVASLAGSSGDSSTPASQAVEASAVAARWAELAPRLEALVAKAPASEPGLGIDLVDPSAHAAKEAAWTASLGTGTSTSTSLALVGTASTPGSARAAAPATAPSPAAPSAVPVAPSAVAPSAVPVAPSAIAPAAVPVAPSAAAPAAVLVAPSAAAPSHDGFEAAADQRISQAVLAGRALTAPAYLHFHMIELRAELGTYLAAQLRSTGSSQVAFVDSPGHFVAELLRPLRPDDASACVTALQAWVAPLDLFAIVDRNRAIFEAAAESRRRVDYDHGARGPAGWASTVATAIGAALQAQLVGSLARMSPRLVAATAARRASAGAGAVTTRDLLPSTPLDAEVARAFVGHAGATVTVAPGASQLDPAAEVRHRAVTALRWQGDLGGPWNAVQAVSPADAGPEELAQALLGSWSQAYRLVRIGSTYLVPEDEAARHADAVRSRPAGRPAGSAEHALVFGAGASAAIAAEAERSLALPPASAASTTAAEAERSHALGPVSAASTITAALGSQWQRIDEQLRGLLLVVGRFGVASELSLAYVLHAQRRAGLETLTGHDAEVQATAFTRQATLLVELAAEIAGQISQLEHVRRAAGTHAPPLPVLLDTLRTLVLAASRSHLAETGRRLLEEARTARRAAIFDNLEALVGQATTNLEVAHRLAQHTTGRSNYSAHLLGKPLGARRDALAAELAAVRAGAIATGELDPEQVGRLFQRIDRLRFEAELISSIGNLGQMFDGFDQLESDRWTLFSEAMTDSFEQRLVGDAKGGGRIGRLEALRRGAFELQSALATIHSRWLKVEQRAQLFDAGTGTEPAGTSSLVATVARPAIEAELEAIRQQLATLGGNERVRAFLTHAAETARSAQLRATITQIVTLLSVTIASGGAGAFAEGVATGVGASALGAQLVGLAVETTAFSGLSARLSATPLGHELLHNFLGNLAAFGAMRLAKAAVAGSRLGKIIDAGRAAGRGVYWAARVGEISATTIAAAGVQFAQAEAESYQQRGRLLSSDELLATGLQGMAMMIGGAIIHHGLTSSIDEVKAFGASAAADASRARALDHLAHQLADHGDPAMAIQLLRDLTVELNARQARWRDLAAMPPHELVARGLSPAVVATMSAASRQHLTELKRLGAGTLPAQLGLDTVVPGHVYAGPPDAIAKVVELYQAQGYAIETDGPLTVITRPGQPPIHVLERAAARPHVPDVQPLARELHGLLLRDPEAFVARYQRASRELPPPALEALRSSIRDQRVPQLHDSTTSHLGRVQLIELHARRIRALQVIGEIDQMAFHGTNSDMFAGLAQTDGEILPAAALAHRGVSVGTGEGPKFSRGGKPKDFISIGRGESGFGTSLAYADASGTLEHYNPRLISDLKLRTEIVELQYIVDHFDSIQINVEGPFKSLGAREKAHFEAELSKLQEESKRRSTRSLTPQGADPSTHENYPVLFDIDMKGISARIVPRADVRPGQALGGEASVFGGIDLKTRLRRVYVPEEKIADATQRLTKILGHNNFEVLAIEAVAQVPNQGEIGSSRLATRRVLTEMERDLARVQRAYTRAIREGRIVDGRLIAEELLTQ